ncbi:hypothetical protein DOY81_002575, partial [Sarcophaga bullata]
ENKNKSKKEQRNTEKNGQLSCNSAILATEWIMGICLDTVVAAIPVRICNSHDDDGNDDDDDDHYRCNYASAVQDTGEQGNEWNRTQNPNSARDGGGGGRAVGSANANAIDMQNAGKIKFDPPKVPVIFVLGGPGSGKVTHCDTFMQERRGVTHINMMDLLQQYAMGNDMQDFSQLSSKTVTEVLMLEMKMAPAAKAYLISGYPRSMRDVVEYSEKIQVVNGVILISWRQSVLQKQIDYGAKLGHVVLSLAKMELDNFFKNVMPVADYFDQSDMLIAVNGERAPSEVYKDFRTAVLDILSTLENQEAILNGVTASNAAQAVAITTGRDVITKQPMLMNNNTSMGTDMNRIPPVIWVIGGPGSNKATLCMKAVGLNPGWAHFSVGRLLRSITDSAPRANTESYAIKEALAAGEMVPEKSIHLILETNLKQFSDKTGVIIDGFPRNMQQVKYFEDKYKQLPPIVLLDCSKLQLGRGRIDDTVSSFRRRLELFREQTLPMLKAMDNSNRLQIIDGDTDSPSVQREFEKSIRNHIQKLTGTQMSNNVQRPTSKQPPPPPHMEQQTDTIIQDLENNVPGAVPTISHHVSLMNGHIKNRNTSANQLANNNHNKTNTNYMNGDITGQTGQMDFRHMLQEAERYPVDSYM